MFARIVTMRLKPTNIAEHAKAIEMRVLPLLQKEAGFVDAMFFVSQDGLEAIGMTLWDRKEDADHFGNTLYVQILQSLNSLLEDVPLLTMYDVTNSTFHKSAAQ
jgi:hypothetical protein